jgi:hypothetical protein
MKSLIFGLLLGIFALPGVSVAAEELFTPVEAILPLQGATRAGAIVPLGQTSVESDPVTGAVHAVDPTRNLGFVRWFPRHLPLKAETFADAKTRLLVSVEGTQQIPVKAAWRLAGDSSRGTEVEGTLIPDGEGSAVATLDVPALPEGREADGIFLLFPNAGQVTVQKASLVLPVAMLVEAKISQDPRKSSPLEITGRGASPNGKVTVSIKPEKPTGTLLDLEVKADGKGGFSAKADPGRLAPGDYVVSASQSGTDKLSPLVKIFVFPVLTGESAPRVRMENGRLFAGDKPLGFVGVNYSPFHLDLPRDPDYREVVRNLVEMHSWGVRVIRLPFSISTLQPAEGVFPDHPEWAATMRKHNLDPEIFPLLEYFIQVAGQMRMHSVIDWHGMPTDPYHYHSGGQPADKDAGKPGTAVAWLAPSATAAVEFDPSKPRHRKMILSSHTWIARHFQGNPNLLGIEIPYNEPHDRFMAVEKNWRDFTNEAAAAVAEGDPARLTFTMPSAYGHDNLSPSATWIPPDRASGGAPHFYLANGPVAARPDAKDFPMPYLARDVEDSFAYAQASVFLPWSATNYPIYNGEGGEFGNECFLPDEKHPDRAEWIIEAQIVQAYAAGWTGYLNWTLWNHETDFIPYREIYERVSKRFAPVFAAGALDRTKAEVAFVQSPGAVPPSNGMNHACVPLARLALALHLPFVHYYTDQQFLYSFRASVPTGLEQVEEGTSLSRYKALIVDRRNLDTRAASLAEISGVPVLWTDDASSLSSSDVAAFLTKHGVTVDTKTPELFQVIEGPEHLLVYLRGDRGQQGRVYPHLRRAGAFRLLDEAGREVFQGDAATLATKGLAVDLPRWRSAIYRLAD